MAPVPSLAIRLVHVLAMAALFGGAVLTWGVFRTAEEPPRGAAVAYEWLFWLAAGLVVMTGVGNLGSMAPGIPGLGTAWGLAFGLKLIAVVGLLIGSAVRTLAVIRWLAAEAPSVAPETTRRLAGSYAATAGYLLLVVALAEVLAHG